MNTLENNDSMADFLRLQNLKGLTNRRLRGRADKQFADMQNPDLEGTSFEVPEYLPEHVPGNFDVRANLKIEPPPMQQGPTADDGGIWSKISNGLRSIGAGRLPEQDDEPMSQAMAQPAPKNLTQQAPSNAVPLIGPGAAQALFTPQGASNILLGNRELLGEPLQAGLNPMQLFGALGAGLQSLLGGGKPQEEAGQLPNPLAPPLANGSEQANQPMQPNPNSALLSQQEPQALTEPGAQTQPGSVSRVMQDPTLKSRIDEIFGTIDPAMANAASSYENAMNAYSNSLDDVTAKLTDREKSIRDRIEKRELSTQDKILMTLALVAPMIASGLIGGKEGLLGALGGGAKGLSQVFGGRAKEAKEDQEALSGLALDKAKISKEKAGIEPLTADFRSKVASSIPNKDLREIFSRDGELVGDKLVIKSGNENLPIKSEAIRDIEDYKRIKKEIPKYAQTLSSTEQSMEVIDSMHKLLDAANSSKDNLISKGLSYIPFYDAVSGATKAFIPWTRDTVKDEQGHEYKISELYNTLRTQLSEIWRKSNSGSNSNAFKATEEHFFQQLPDPFGKTAFLSGKSDINQNKKQLDLVKDKFTRNILSYLDEQGIDTTNIEKKLSSSGRNKELSDNDRKRQRVNQAVEQSIRGSNG